MLPVIPFEVLIPLTIFAVLLCLGTVAVILGRRASVKWWSREGERLADQASALLAKARDGNPQSIQRWLTHGAPGRIDGLVRAAKRIEASDGELRSWIGDTGVPDRLVQILTKQSGRGSTRRDRWGRVAAAQALGDLGLIEGLDALVDGIEEEDTEIAYASAGALATLDTGESAAAILDQISSTPILNNSRLASLIESMSCELTEVFRAQLRRTDSAALFWTATLIGEKEMFDLVVEVRPLLESGDANVRAAAAECVGDLKIPLTDRWLAPLLHDEAWFVQSHAAKSLGELRATWAVDELAELLHESEWWLRQNAADALVKIGRDAIEAVRKLLHDKDRFARNSAVEILERIGWIHIVLDEAVRDDEEAADALPPIRALRWPRLPRERAVHSA